MNDELPQIRTSDRGSDTKFRDFSLLFGPDGFFGRDTGFWRIEFKQSAQDGNIEHGSFYLKQLDGRWRIAEKPHWLHVAKREKDWSVMW